MYDYNFVMISIAEDQSGWATRKEPCQKNSPFSRARQCSQDCLRIKGYCFQRHDFLSVDSTEWNTFSRSECLEVCVNFTGSGEIETGSGLISVTPDTLYYSIQHESRAQGMRHAGERHQFFMVHLSRHFLALLAKDQPSLLPIAARYLDNALLQHEVVTLPMPASIKAMVTPRTAITIERAQEDIWHEQRIQKFIRQLLASQAPSLSHCTRTQRLNQERIKLVRDILHNNMSNPPILEELAKMVHCSPFYLSRQFTQVQGMTMQQYLRQIRLERAAEMLRTGEGNVTEVALEVGYNSLSHFSTAFHEMYGCCPGLYALKGAPPPISKSLLEKT
jgi:AraC-like DNA-binding protein